MENLEILIRCRRAKEQINTSHVERSFSQNQEEYFSFQCFELETNLEKSLLRSKSESYLKQDEITPNKLQSCLLDSLWHNLQSTINTEENYPLIHTSQPNIRVALFKVHLLSQTLLDTLQPVL